MKLGGSRIKIQGLVAIGLVSSLAFASPISAGEPKRQARASAPVARKPLLKQVKAANAAPRGVTASERQLQDDLDRGLGERTFNGSKSGVYVLDMKTGKLLYSYSAELQLNPASNVKLVSTATALDVLGPDFAYQTRLLGPHPDDNGTVHGDVWLVGMGDPTLAEKDLVQLAGDLGERGIKRITGAFVVSSDNERDVLGRPRFAVKVSAGAVEGELPVVTVEPESAYVIVENRASVSSKARLAKTCRSVRKKGSRKRHRVCSAPRPAELKVETREESGPEGPRLLINVSGRLRPGQQVALRRYAPEPAAFTAHTLRAHALRAGIVVDGGVRLDTSGARESLETGVPGAELAELAVHKSLPLGVLVAMVNKPSNNYLADRLIELVGGHLYGEATLGAGVRAMTAYLGRIGIAPGSFELENGSGLSYRNTLSVHQIADVLVSSWKDGRIGQTFFASMSIAGKDGTLKGRFRGRESKGFVFGKTGTLTGVAALSGYVTVDGGHVICFAIVTNGFRKGRKQSIRAGQAKLVDSMYRYLRREEAARDRRALPEPAGVAPELEYIEIDSEGEPMEGDMESIDSIDPGDEDLDPPPSP